MDFFINNFSLLDEAESSNLVMNGIRSIFGFICGCLYNWIAGLVNAMYEIAGVLNVDGQDISNFVASISDKLFVIILIYMIFRGTITMLNYLVDPETFQDKSKGGAAFIKRILISIVLLISINPIFNLLGKVQDDIINSDIITSVFNSGTKSGIIETEDGKRVYLVHMSSFCGDDYKTMAFTQGDHFALEALKSFIQPKTFDPTYDSARIDQQKSNLDSLAYCGIEITQEKIENGEIEYIDSSDWGYASTLGAGVRSYPSLYFTDDLLNSVGDKALGVFGGNYDINFDFFFCLIIGIFILLILISFTFDVVIRAFNLIVLKVLAPIPIIAYMSPKGKESELLGTWVKKVISTWASLFIRLIALSFALSVISFIIEADILANNSLGMVETILVICGVLMFAKKLPQLLEEIIPGFKLSGGFELNPFKRVANDALGGKAALGLAAGAGAMALGAGTNFAQRAAQGVNEMSRATNTREALRAVFGGAARTVGSTIAGGTRAGINAFNRTRKDGNMFGGLWNGYQTSMYSKLKREEFRRQGGTIGGTISADLHRWAGTLTEGQREAIIAEQQDQEIAARQAVIDGNQRQLNETKEELANRKRQHAENKANELRPYEMYTEQAVKIKDRLKAVVEDHQDYKDALASLEQAKASGSSERVRLAQNFLNETRSRLRTEYLNGVKEDEILNERIQEIDNFVRDHQELRQFNDRLFEIKNGRRTKVDDNTLAGIQYTQEQISSSYKDAEATFEADQRRIDERQVQIDADKERIEEFKRSDTYKIPHDKMSAAKVANSQKFNNEPQAAGTTFAAGQSVYGGVMEGQVMPGYFDANGDGNFGGGRPRGGGRPPGPPPGGAPH